MSTQTPIANNSNSFWETRKPRRFLNAFGLVLTIGIALYWGPAIYKHFSAKRNPTLPPELTLQIHESAKLIAVRAQDEIPTILKESDGIMQGDNALPVEPQGMETRLDHALARINAFLDQWETLIDEQTNNIRSRGTELHLALDSTRIEQELRRALYRLSEEDLKTSPAFPLKKMGLFPGINLLTNYPNPRQEEEEAANAERQAQAEAASKRPCKKIGENLGRLIANLLRVRNQVKNPRAKQAIEAVILRIRSLGRIFDCTPPTVTVILTPLKAIYALSDLDPGAGGAGILVTITARDGLSGLDPATLTARANVNGNFFPLSTTVTQNDPITATLTATTRIFNTTIPDGEVRIQASINDKAGNTGTGTSPFFIKDTVAPEIRFLSPSPGGTLEGLMGNNPDSLAVLLSILFSDEVTGVNPQTIQFLLDGLDFSSPARDLFRDGQLSFIPVLPSGNHSVQVIVSDFAGNTNQQTVSFRVIGPDERPAIRLVAVSGDGEEGLANTSESTLIKVKAESLANGQGVPGITLALNVVAGDGSLEVLGSDSTTDGDGIVTAKFIYGTSALFRESV